MKRIALALAAATLGTGCIVTTDNTTTCAPRTLTIDWTFTDADGVARVPGSGGCTQMGITGVNLFYDGAAVSTTPFPCGTGYQTLDDTYGALTPGQHAVLVEGVDSTGYVVARSNAWVTVASCGDSYTTADATEGYVRLDYSIAPVNVCGGGYMWFKVHDSVANYDAAVIDQNSSSTLQTTYACGNQAANVIQFPLAAGDYTLDWIEEVGTPLTAPTPLDSNCSPTAFTISGPGTQPVPVTLTATTTFCP